MNTLCYNDGNEIRLGDQVCYGRLSGTVVFVIEAQSCSSDFPPDEWSYLGRGFMMDVEEMGLVHLAEPDEDLQLVARAPGAKGTLGE